MNKVTLTKMPELPYALEEAINRLRINISFLGSDIKKIMVISTMPNEGKSFVAMQLWRQMAAAEISSVLVDMDLRKSVIPEKYGLEAEGSVELKGTSWYLSHDDMPIEDVICQTELEYGHLMPNMDNVVNPSLLLESGKFEEMLDTLAEQYRYVLVDCPPLSLVSDGERIGNLCDGAILVVRGGITPKSMVRNSIMQLERAGCPLLGIVLNRVEGARNGYYYKKYGGHYYYSSDYYYGK